MTTSSTASSEEATIQSTPSAPTVSSRLTRKQLTNNNTEGHVVRNSLLAGSVSGIVSTIACYPFDTIRTKMQSAAVETASSSATSATARGMSASVLRTARPSASHQGPLQVLMLTLEHGGLRALYTGMMLPLTAQAVYKATVFTVNNLSQTALVEWKTQERFKLGHFGKHKLTLSDRFWCGFAGGAVNAALFVTPVEFVRNQLIAQHSRRVAVGHGSTPSVLWNGPRDVIRYTIAKQGVGHLWRGLGMAVARDSLGCGCFFVVHQWTTERWRSDRGGEDKTSATVKLMAGGAAGLAYWAAALPLDTAKTWVQNGSSESGVRAVSEYIKQEGILSTARRLCRGWQVAFGRGIPAAAITMATYESSYMYFQEM